MNRTGVLLFLFGLLIAVVVLGVQQYIGWQYVEKFFSGETAKVNIGELTVRVELVTSNTDMQRGLSGRAKLPQGYGMLFDFPKKELDVPFWMEGMNFPLDIIWILDGKVVGVERSIDFPKGNEEPITVVSPGFVSEVLEVPAGVAQQVSAGDSVDITY